MKYRVIEADSQRVVGRYHTFDAAQEDANEKAQLLPGVAYQVQRRVVRDRIFSQSGWNLIYSRNVGAR